MIPNHIKIGNAEKFISQYISEHSFSKIGFLVDSNSADYCLKQIEQKFSFESLDLNFAISFGWKLPRIFL